MAPTQDALESRTDRAQRTEPKKKKNRGNFANDPERAREAGRKGGRARGRVR